MSFADLAFERLNKTAPELTSLVISFSDLSEELGEDSVIKLGVFTLRSGGTFSSFPYYPRERTYILLILYFHRKTRNSSRFQS